jgi:transposase
VPDAPGVPSAQELAVLPHAELAARLSGAYRVIAVLTAQVQELSLQVTDLQAQVAGLQRKAGRDSSTSSKSPSSDSPYKKKGRDRSARERGKRPPGKQPGEPGTTMRLVEDPRGAGAHARARGQRRLG